MPYLITIIILTLMIGIYIVSFLLNKETSIPEGLEDRYAEAQTCSGCHAKKSMMIPEEVIVEFKEENSLWQFYIQF